MRDTRVSHMVFLTPLAEEEEEEEEGGEEGGSARERREARARHRMGFFFFVFPLCIPWCFLFLFGGLGMKEIRAPFEDGYPGLGQVMVIS